MSDKPYELLIFDWDGTVIDSTGAIVNILTKAARAVGLPERDPEKLRALIGLGMQEMAQRLYPKLPSQRVLDWRTAYLAIHPQHQHQEVLFTGTKQTLKALKAEGYELAVATGKSRTGLDRSLVATGLMDLFAITRCVDEAASKPAPDMVEDILIKTANVPERTLVIGDSQYDMLMAKAAGADCIGVASGVHSRELLEAAGAQHVLATVADLPTWLARH